MKKILVLALLLSVAFGCRTKNTKKDESVAVEKQEIAKNENTATQEPKEVEINWMSFEEAITAQKKEPKKIMMDAYTKWCGPCKLLDRKTFHNPDLVAYVNEHYYAVKFNAEGDETITFKGNTFTNPGYDPTKATRRNASHQLSGYFRINAYPTILFLDENAEVLTPIKGYYTPAQLEIYLKLFAQDDFKKIKTAEEWQTYQDNFINTFKEI